MWLDCDDLSLILLCFDVPFVCITLRPCQCLDLCAVYACSIAAGHIVGILPNVVSGVRLLRYSFHTIPMLASRVERAPCTYSTSDVSSHCNHCQLRLIRDQSPDIHVGELCITFIFILLHAAWRAMAAVCFLHISLSCPGQGLRPTGQ